MRPNGVDTTEAQRRLNLQGLIGEIGAKIEADEAGRYGGHWIQHAPDFEVVLAATNDEGRLRSQYFGGAGLESIVEVRVVDHTLRDLRQQLERLVQAQDSDWRFDARVNVPNNTVDVDVLDRDAFLRGAQDRLVELPPLISISVVGGLAEATTAMYGGRPLTSCTSGFSVHSNALGIDGLTTAMHCSNSQSYVVSGESLTFVAQNGTSGHDEQWHKRTGATFPNKAWDGNPDWRWITGKKSRLNISVGDYVCHWGKSTGYGCGNVESRDAVACNNGPGGLVGIEVHNSGNQDLSTGGDSGGPWYLGETAYGTMSCQSWVEPYGFIDAIFVASNYVESGLSVTIKTSP